MEVEWKNRKRKRGGKLSISPLYTAEDAEASLKLFEPIVYNELVQIDENIIVRFNDAGHMLGSSIIEIWVKEDRKDRKNSIYRRYRK